MTDEKGIIIFFVVLAFVCIAAVCGRVFSKERMQTEPAADVFEEEAALLQEDSTQLDYIEAEYREADEVSEEEAEAAFFEQEQVSMQEQQYFKPHRREL